jgi:hypothetical protein
VFVSIFLKFPEESDILGDNAVGVDHIVRQPGEDFGPAAMAGLFASRGKSFVPVRYKKLRKRLIDKGLCAKAGRGSAAVTNMSPKET